MTIGALGWMTSTGPGTMREIQGWFLPDEDQHFAAFLQQYPRNSYQQQSLDLALSHCGSRGLVLDIGANIGLFATRFAGVFAKVVCFEPTTVVYDCLRMNCRDQSNVEVFKMALGQEPALLDISAPRKLGNCGVYSLVDFPNTSADIVSERVFVARLDDFGLAPDLIKIDTQGYECQVLQGAVMTLQKHSPVLLLEAEGKTAKRQLGELLEPLGYVSVGSVRHDWVWVRS